MRTARVVALALVARAAVLAQSPTDPFPGPIPANEDVIRSGSWNSHRFPTSAASPHG